MFDRVLAIGIDAADHGHDLRLVCSGVYEIGPKFADGGLCLEAAQLPLDDVTLGAGFYIFGIDDLAPPTFRVTVGWHRSWTHDRQAGFGILEYCSQCQPTSADEGRRFVNRVLPGFERTLREALDRQRPPSRVRHIWQRLVRHVPPPEIMTHPNGSVRAYPDLRTFAETYDR